MRVGVCDQTLFNFLPAVLLTVCAWLPGWPPQCLLQHVVYEEAVDVCLPLPRVSLNLAVFLFFGSGAGTLSFDHAGTVLRFPESFLLFRDQCLAMRHPLHGMTHPSGFVEFFRAYGALLLMVLRVPLTPIIRCTGTVDPRPRPPALVLGVYFSFYPQEGVLLLCMRGGGVIARLGSRRS